MKQCMRLISCFNYGRTYPRLVHTCEQSHKSLHKRTFSILSNNESNKDAFEWLVESGVQPQEADEVIKVYKQTSGTATISDLKQLGATGLESLLQSIRKELQEKDKIKVQGQDKVTLLINNPRVSNELRKIEIYENETLYNTLCAPVIDDLEFACGGNAACSTCHVILEPRFYSELPPPEEDELDMLDLAWEPTDTSRLACQMVVNKNCNNMVITIPSESNNLF